VDIILLGTDSALLERVTCGGNTVLHIAAGLSSNRYCGCFTNDPYQEFAKAVDTKNSRVLRMRNKLNETAVHCAAKAGNSDMVSCLIDLAANDEAFLETRNIHGETALHEAVRSDSKDAVKKFINRLSRLANVEDNNHVSPLYLATMSKAGDIVNVFINQEDKSEVSFAGPYGQTALHAAVLDNEGVHSFI
jgi:ankyrin repeat protein